ncbi:MAG TPA: FAD-dependent thymidylate synthase [Bryobacterales bacterium]|nr:FAD-dependent thymidylate synthase [Bryobacterales bacterium]
MSSTGANRVIAVSPMPPEKSAYALARYSRSPDSISQSLDWVRAHDSAKFLESYYFQYGHASIADLGHTIFCFEGISELAAVEIEDEPLWDGQAKSSRYQDFSRSGFVVPPEIAETGGAAVYKDTAGCLLEAYLGIHQRAFDYLVERTPKPESMKAEAYRRALAARAFDVARYVLFLGIPTNVGQVTSIRTLEKQIRRLSVSRYAEIRQIAAEMRDACAQPPVCVWDAASSREPLAPTLARHADPDVYLRHARRNVAEWAAQNLPAGAFSTVAAESSVDLVRPRDAVEEIVATLLYSVTQFPFRAIYDQVSGWSASRKREVIDAAVRDRSGREELLREFRSGYAFVFDIVTDIGAYRDLHRHRRCQQIRQDFTAELGLETPALIAEAGAQNIFHHALHEARLAREQLAAVSPEATHYLLPFAARVRFLYKMDFAEAEYVSRLRSGVKGHFAYRAIAWKMKEKVMEVEPDLGRLIEATPPWVEDPLIR